MKKSKSPLLVIILSLFALPSFSQNSDNELRPGDVVSMTEMLISNIQDYLPALIAGNQAFARRGSKLTGFCEVVSGGVPGEAFVFSFHESMEDSLAAITDPRQLSDRAPFTQYREITGARRARVLKPYSGELYETWAARTIVARPENPEEYLAALSELESAAHANGFGDFSIAVQQAYGAGTMVGLFEVILVSPTLARFGATSDAISVEDWAQNAVSNIVAARSSLISDRILSCQQIYVPM